MAYSNLIVGKEYTINGKLMDKETGKETGYTASKTFIAEKPDGEINIEFEVDASALAGKSVVAFETLNYEGVELTSHADLTDEDQTVDIPEIATHAADKATQTHVVSYGDKVIVEDKVTYKNLTVGREYTMKGTLMLKTKDGVKDTGITAEKVFVPETRNGEVVLEFVVDSTKYAGEALVAYEKLFDKDIEIAKHEDIEDEDQTVYVPEIKTSASSNGSKGIVASKDCVITDTVTYRNFVPGLSYKVSGKLMDKATGKPLSSNGQLITAETAFTPSSPDGTVDVTFKFDASACSSMAIVVFEELTLNGVIVAVHEDINDEDQTVRFPEIATHAADKATQTHVVSYGDNVIVEDKVTYKNLTVGREYTMKGTLMLKGDNGVSSTGITAEKTFKPEKPDGEAVLEFVVDSTKYAGKALVAYEKLFDKDIEIAKHEDIEDEDQTVYVPEIKTNASIGGEKTADVSKTTVIIDTVSYKNLVPGLEYTMHGKLINKANGNALSIGGKAVTSEVKFTPVSADGTVEMKFAFDSSACKGMSVVVFEDLSLAGKLVATHSDITDKDQTVTFNTLDNPDTPEEPDKPSIRTNASVGSMKQAAASESTTIVDTVTYKNLTVGTEYTLKGKLVNKANGKTLSINGKAVTAEMKFTPTEKNGSVDMKFTFNSSACAGMSMVVYEYLYIGSSIVVSHADVDDEAQTVTFRSPKQPEIRTKAEINGKKSVRAAKSVTVTDKVTYKNLVPGTKYTLKGKLVNKASGRTLSISGKALEAEKTFVPEKPDGSVKLEFKFDASACGGMSMVAFEYLYESGRIIATHADINDADQTVTVTDKDMPVVTPSPVPNKNPGKNPSVTPDEPNLPAKVKTGDEYGLIVALFIAAIMVLGVAIVIVKKKENE